jgi:glycosyltransferase involved in cell wall biosynthesis
VRVEGKVLEVVDGVTGPSRDVIARSRTYYGLPLAGAEAIPNPVRLVPADQQWRVEASDPDHIVFVGRFDRHKGGDTIIDAFALLLRDRPSTRLTFVGPDRGLDRDGRHWSLPEYLEHRLPGALDDHRVRWLGRRPPSDVAELRRRAAVTVMASRYETFAITVTEAMAAGCPLVATRAGGASELFEDGIHGRYVAPEDPEGMASALAWMLADPARSARMGAAAAEHCRRHYAPDIVAEQTLRFYRRVLAKRATRGVLAQKESRP